MVTMTWTVVSNIEDDAGRRQHHDRRLLLATMLSCLAVIGMIVSPWMNNDKVLSVKELEYRQKDNHIIDNIQNTIESNDAIVSTTGNIVTLPVAETNLSSLTLLSGRTRRAKKNDKDKEKHFDNAIYEHEYIAAGQENDDNDKTEAITTEKILEDTSSSVSVLPTSTNHDFDSTSTYDAASAVISDSVVKNDYATLLDLLLEVTGSLTDEAFRNPSAMQYKAYQWMSTQDSASNEYFNAFKQEGNTQEMIYYKTKIIQRYAMLVLDYSLGASYMIPHVDICAWGNHSIECTNFTNTASTSAAPINILDNRYSMVEKISWPSKYLYGTIPTEIGLFGTSLKYLDLASNFILGSLPDALYELSSLQYLFLHDNNVTGTISSLIGNFHQLNKLFLGDNEMYGTIPKEIGNALGDEIRRPLNWLNLGNNHFIGSVPEEFKLPKLFYLDISSNNLAGTISESWISSFKSLRILYMYDNYFNGSLPESWAELGGGRMKLLSLHDNELTGSYPGDYEYMDKLNVLEIQNNYFESVISKNLCEMSVNVMGELVRFNADCDVCQCHDLCNINC